MKLPDQEAFDASSTHEDVPAGELESGPSSDPRPDGPLDTDNKELEVPKDPLLFIQLNELLGWPQALEWKETGRDQLLIRSLFVQRGVVCGPCGCIGDTQNSSECLVFVFDIG
ncbi:Anion exchange protein 4 [Tupaia chinensis]|uniref:Anion exchange protein 4 n=1 Tax=Tupaia chinensis TaxID=246437 RepID=L9JV53_TUPCH|nr:Anion exchange protein 4 [Tupaia chinensis]